MKTPKKFTWINSKAGTLLSQPIICRRVSKVCFLWRCFLDFRRHLWADGETAGDEDVEELLLATGFILRNSFLKYHNCLPDQQKMQLNLDLVKMPNYCFGADCLPHWLVPRLLLPPKSVVTMMFDPNVGIPKEAKKRKRRKRKEGAKRREEDATKQLSASCFRLFACL